MKLKDYIEMKTGESTVQEGTLGEHKNYSGEIEKESISDYYHIYIRINGKPDNVCDVREARNIPVGVYIQYGHYDVVDISVATIGAFSSDLLIVIEPPKAFSHYSQKKLEELIC